MVQSKLCVKWSPEQISLHLAQEYPERAEMRVCPETIYQALYVQGRSHLRADLHRHLRTGRAVRRPRGSSVTKRGKIANMILISERPAEVAEEQSTREKFRERLRAGHLEARMVELDVPAANGPLMQVIGPMSLDDMGVNLQDMFGSLMPKKMKRRRMSVAEARTVLSNEEAQKLIDQEAAIREAVQRVENSGIVFIDEIDKIAGAKAQGAGPDVSREGVQRDLLPIVEGSNVNTKYGMVKTDHVLFIASGAFHVAKPSDLIPELQGRFPIRVELNSLTQEDFVKILTLPQNALIKQYAALVATEGLDLEFQDEAIREIARVAADVNEQVENIGARRLHTILTTLLEEILFNAPDEMPQRHIVITQARVQERLSSIVRNRDMSRYIL